MKNTEKNDKKRKLINPIEILFIIIILFVCIGFWYYLSNQKANDGFAQISYKGKIIKEIDLKNAADEVFLLKGTNKVSFQIENGKIKFVDVDCPDKLCENFGYLSRQNETAICLPNMVSLKIISKGKNNNIDIIAN